MNNRNKIMKEYTLKDFLTFIIPSLIGAFVFLWPTSIDGEMNIPLGLMINEIKSFIADFGMHLIVLITLVSTLGSLLVKIFNIKFKDEKSLFKIVFDANWVILGAKFIALFIVISLHFNLQGPFFNLIVNDDTGRLMIDLSVTLLATFMVVTYVLPLISDYGLMDFTGNIFRRLIHPLFKLPGRSAVDLVSSWVGGNAAGILVTIRQYESGFYTAREAVTISTMFSVVSLPFCLVIAQTLNVAQYFVPLYLVLIVVGVISTIIMVRIPPISKVPNTTFKNKTLKTSEDIPQGETGLHWGLKCALESAKQAGSFRAKLVESFKGSMDLIFNVVPTVITIGTIGLVLATFTPLFNWLSYPFMAYLKVLGVQEAGAAAPTMIVGFTDMFLPAIMGASIVSVQTRFIIGVVSLVQIIYLSEMAAVLLASTIPVKMKDLIVIFLVKTAIAIPLTVILTKLLSFASIF